MKVQPGWKYTRQLETKVEDLKHINGQLLEACSKLLSTWGLDAYGGRDSYRDWIGDVAVCVSEIRAAVAKAEESKS